MKIGRTSGALEFKSEPDYEAPKGGANGKSNVYEVTVQASDGGNTGVRAVTVKVKDIDEDGEVTLSLAKPEVGVALTATLTDPDGDPSNVTWEWARTECNRNGVPD